VYLSAGYDQIPEFDLLGTELGTLGVPGAVSTIPGARTGGSFTGTSRVCEAVANLFPVGSHLCCEPMPTMSKMKRDMEILKQHGFNLISILHRDCNSWAGTCPKSFRGS
jgi:hypothetical protein